jgi:hypothetical protein
VSSEISATIIISNLIRIRQHTYFKLMPCGIMNALTFLDHSGLSFSSSGQIFVEPSSLLSSPYPADEIIYVDKVQTLKGDLSLNVKNAHKGVCLT